MNIGRSHRSSCDEIQVYREVEEAVITLVEGLLKHIDALEERVSPLECQLNKANRNSHKPPSSDRFKQHQHVLRPKSRNASGRQKKHPG